jgi:hypothetical protein
MIAAIRHEDTKARQTAWRVNTKSHKGVLMNLWIVFFSLILCLRALVAQSKDLLFRTPGSCENGHHQ